MLLLIAASIPLAAQPADPVLAPGAGYFVFHVQAGAVLVRGSGSFTSTCECTFDESPTGFGAYLGAGFSYGITDNLRVLARMAVQQYTAAYEKTRTVTIPARGSDGTIRLQKVMMRRSADMSLTRLSCSLLGQWHSGIGRFWLAGGPEFSLVLPGRYTDADEILGCVADYQTTGTPCAWVVTDKALDAHFADLRIGLVSVSMIAGYDFVFMDTMTLTPEIGWSYQLTALIPTHPSLQHNPVQFGVSLGMRL
ncbi:MAG: hypothetical protein HY962_13845 [Ignavibacteriae bacterium]|nr:hypothetical protein [Ignavibacteriota bacterium]